MYKTCHKNQSKIYLMNKYDKNRFVYNKLIFKIEKDLNFFVKMIEQKA